MNSNSYWKFNLVCISEAQNLEISFITSYLKPVIVMALWYGHCSSAIKSTTIRRDLIVDNQKSQSVRSNGQVSKGNQGSRQGFF